MDDLIFWAPIDLCNWIICCLSRTFNKRRSPRTHTLTQTHSLYSWKGWKNMQFLKLASLSIIKCLHLFWCCDNLQRITEIFRNGTRSYECRIAQAITFIPTRIGWVSDWCFAVTRAVDKHSRADESFDRVLVLICRCGCIVRNLCTQRWTLIHYCLRCACITLSFSHWQYIIVDINGHQSIATRQFWKHWHDLCVGTVLPTQKKSAVAALFIHHFTFAWVLNSNPCL